MAGVSHPSTAIALRQTTLARLWTLPKEHRAGIKMLTSAALAAALRASSELEAPSLPPRVRPGVLAMTFCGTGAELGFAVEFEPSVRPGAEKLSG